MMLYKEVTIALGTS